MLQAATAEKVDEKMGSFVWLLCFLLALWPLNQGGTISQSSSETSFKLFRFTVGLSHLGKLSFAQASAYVASANAKKSKQWIFGPSIHRAKNENFRNLTNYIPIDPKFYAGHYSQKDYTLKSNCKKDVNRNVALYPETLFEAKTLIFKN